MDTYYLLFLKTIPWYADLTSSMSRTPSKTVDTLSTCFTPKELKTPSKDLPGLSKTVFTHISTLHGLLSDWTKVQAKGAKVCKAIAALKLHEYNEDYYPQQLAPLTENLLSAVEGFKNIVDAIEIIIKQLKAVSKLQPTSQPVISTWSASQISTEVDRVYRCIEKEYRLKSTITENIAHCRDELLIDVYTASWEHDVYFDLDSVAYLFAEVGLSAVT